MTRPLLLPVRQALMVRASSNAFIASLIDRIVMSFALLVCQQSETVNLYHDIAFSDSFQLISGLGNDDSSCSSLVAFATKLCEFASERWC